MKLTVNRALLALALAGFGPVSSLAMADGDSSSDAAGGFAAHVAQSQAVIIQVPINAQGEELTDAADMRLYQGADLNTNGDFASAFATAQPAADQPEVDVSADSSTHGSYGWSSWRNNGWSYNYYYNYRPTYYYNTYSYNYYTPYYRNYYTGGNYYGYRYYYYRRCW
jgi:hypothetical protein